MKKRYNSKKKKKKTQKKNYKKKIKDIFFPETRFFDPIKPKVLYQYNCYSFLKIKMEVEGAIIKILASHKFGSTFDLKAYLRLSNWGKGELGFSHPIRRCIYAPVTCSKGPMIGI